MVFTEFKDIYRDDTIKTYKEWLRVQGQLDDICNITSFHQISTKLLSVLRKPFIVYICDLLCAGAYDNPGNQIDVPNSSQDNNPTPPLYKPSHARRKKTHGNSKNIYC